MDRVGQLHAALRLAEKLGYQVRYECLEGTQGGACICGGRKWLFLDLKLSVDEQLERVLEALAQEGAICRTAARPQRRAA